MMNSKSSWQEALWQIYRRPDVPQSWVYGDGNLPWNDPEFSQRMLREHLDEGHGAASRQTSERTVQIEWLWRKLQLQPGCKLLDVTCGPGLYAVAFAQRGVDVTAVDFSPAAIGYGRELAEAAGMNGRCHFHQQDIRHMELGDDTFDAAMLIYGQLAVFRREEAQAVLADIRRRLRPGGKLCLELLNPEKVDRNASRWWFTDDKGLWGNTPFLHLGERFWLAEEQTSVERFYVIDIESGQLMHIELCDQTYLPGEMAGMLQAVGFTAVDVYTNWDGLPLYDAAEWIVYVAQ
ncbi:MAG: class I SAM-dependent methyltransferase [Ardenticatenaceae bacterium]|nr:class I SAM-dependent methyltransferase [Ardenticatenaceae bacterium]